MARTIDVDAVINSIRLAEQSGDVSAVDSGYWHLYVKEGGLYVMDDAEILAGPLGTAFEPGGRLTLTTAVPVTTADVTAAATIYYTPYKHNMISLFDGARWIPKTFTELSLDIAAYTASKPYDIFAYLNSGAVALEGLVWTDATNRATALAYQNGRLVKNGAATRLYLGSIYVNSSGGQTDDSILKRNVFNYYNRVSAHLRRTDANSHTYGTNSFRAWNNNTTLTLEFMCGVLEDAHQIMYFADIDSGNASYAPAVAFGYDVTNANMLANSTFYNSNTDPLRAGVSFGYMPTVGFHVYNLIEIGTGGNSTFNNMTGSVLLRK